MEKGVWIGPCVPIAEFYVTMRYVLYVMKNLYKLKSIVPFLYGIWRIAYVWRYALQSRRLWSVSPYPYIHAAGFC
jgi:hypothetical protein